VRKLYFGAATLWTGFIAVACLASMENFKDISLATEEGVDKYVHACFYVLLTALWTLYAYRKFPANRAKIRFWVFILSVLFGLVIEIFQGLFTEDRSPDLFDVCANSSGSALAILIFWVADKIKK
jgi:VanZ family protein